MINIEREVDISKKLTLTLMVNTQNTLHNLINDEEKINFIISIVLTSYLNAMAHILLHLVDDSENGKNKITELLNGFKKVLSESSFIDIIKN